MKKILIFSFLLLINFVNAQLEASYSKHDILCAFQTDGMIVGYGVNGTSPYNYALTGAAVANNTHGRFTGLAAGTYNLTITDSGGSPAIVYNNIVISNVNNLTVSPSTATICSGSPQVLTATGTPVFTWSPNTNLSATTGVSVTAFPTSTITYSVRSPLVTAANRELIINGNFNTNGVGNESFGSDHQHFPFSFGGYMPRYAIAANPNSVHPAWPAWGGANNRLVVDAMPGAVAWRQTVPVDSGVTYYFDYQAILLSNLSPPDLGVFINGILINIFGPGQGLNSGVWNYPSFASLPWASGAATVATIEIRVLNGDINGTDFALDNITFYGTETCTPRADATITVSGSTATPTITTTAATCLASGTATITNYTGGAYTFSPVGPSAGAGGVISGMTPGTSYTVRSGSGACMSSASASFSIAAQLAVPSVPTISSVAATCSAAGSSSISNYVGGVIYTFTPAGPSVAVGGAISGMVVGTSYTVRAGNGSCNSASSSSFSNAAQLTTPSVPTISSVAATCLAAGSSSVSNYTAGVTYTFSPAGPSVAVGGAISGMVVGTSYTVRAGIGSCNSANSSSFSIAAQLAVPSVPTITSVAATCSAAGSSSVSNYTAGVTYTFSPAGPSVAVGGAISGMVVGTSYTVRAGIGSCNSASSSSFSNAGSSSTTWSGTVWNNGAPTLAKAVILNGNYNTNTNGNFECCSLTVNATRTLTITGGRYVTVQNEITNNGTLRVRNNGSLVQVNDASVNTGNIIYERSASQRLQDYVYWSSPVANFNLNYFTTTGGTNYIYQWNPVAVNANGGQGSWGAASGIMTTGKGYIVKGNNSYNNTTPTTWTAAFTGVPNNGVVTMPIQRGTNYTTVGTQGIPRAATDDNWNLIGNPYPSAIGVNEFLTANANINGFVKIWTHGQLPTAAVDPFYQNFTQNYHATDYITVNSTGVSSGPGDYKIGGGQGFFVLMNAGAAGSSNVTFRNNMRSSTFANNQFYKNANTTNNPNRIWLDLISDSTNETMRTLVGYVDGATYDNDRMFDALTDNKNNLNFYSLIDAEPMIIQGRSIPFDVNDKVPMGVKIPTQGSYKIAIATVDGLFLDGAQKIYIEDKELNIIHDLTVSPYSFTAQSGEYNNRFDLRYTNALLSNESFITENSVSIFNNDGNIKTVSSIEKIKNIEVYNVLGQRLASKTNIDANEVEINTILSTNQALIVKVSLNNSQVITKKILF